MQSAGLHSDMESFKAANPGCQLADFVRWYSPRDWTVHATTGEGLCVGSVSSAGSVGSVCSVCSVCSVGSVCSVCSVGIVCECV